MQRSRVRTQPMPWWLPLLLIPFLGLAPHAHQMSQNLRNAQHAASLGFFARAAQYTAKAAMSVPWRADLWESAGRYALQSGEAQNAIQYLERAHHLQLEIGQPPQGGLSSQGLLTLGDAYQQIGDLESAIRCWREISDPFFLDDALERILQAHLALKDYPSAITDLQSMLSNHADDAKLYYQLGMLVATQDPQAAMEYLKKAAELDSELTQPVDRIRRGILSSAVSDDEAYALLVTGQALASLEEWALAAEAFRQATLARPDYAEAWAYLGEAYQHIAKPESDPSPASTSLSDGSAELQHAVELDPTSLAVRTFLALYWTRQGKYELALQEIQVAIDLDPQNPILHLERGNILAMSGDLQAAHNAYQQAVQLAPLDPGYLRQLIRFSLQYRFQLEQVALPAARRLVTLAPANPEALDLMAQVLLQLDDLSNAERFLQRALQADPNYAPAYLHLAWISLLREDRDAAYQALNQVIALHPDDAIADEARRLLQTYFP